MLGSRKLLAAARELGPPATSDWVIALRTAYGHETADAFASANREWEAALAAGDSVRLFRAERVFTRLMCGLAWAVAEVNERLAAGQAVAS